ncbi:hypothetical protein, partial [Escherichia coli]
RLDAAAEANVTIRARTSSITG